MLTDKHALGFKDVLIVPELSYIKSRKEVFLERKFKFENGLEKTFVPIIASNMHGVGTFKVAQVLSKYKMLTCIHKDYVSSEYIDAYQRQSEVFPYIIPTISLHQYTKLDNIIQQIPIDVICLDVANGYMDQFIHFVSQIRMKYPDKVIMAGNVATAEGAEKLYEAGADIVKVGLGSGSVCTTRFKTGVGVPQITAITDCVWKLSETGDSFICSDGGCTSPGDIAKAFVAGADLVMLGGMLAGTQETGSIFNGSATDCNRDYKTSEGKKVSFPGTRPNLEDRVKEILGGLRSTGSYIGQQYIEDFYQADLLQVQEQTNNIYGPPQ